MLYRCGRLLSTSSNTTFTAKRTSATAFAFKAAEGTSSSTVVANSSNPHAQRSAFRPGVDHHSSQREAEEEFGPQPATTSCHTRTDLDVPKNNTKKPQYFTQHPAHALLNDLRQLDTKVPTSNTSPPRLHLETLWKRWTSLHSDIWSTYALPTVTLFIRLAGKMLNPILLGTIAHFVKTYPNIVPATERILHPTASESSPINALGAREGIVVQWAIAESSLGTTNWGGIVQSLRGAGLAPLGRMDDDKMGSFASYVVEEWAERRPDIAFDLYSSAQREGIRLSSRAQFALCQTAIDNGQYDRALEILGQGTIEPEHCRPVVEKMIAALSKEGIVSLNGAMAAAMGESMSAIVSKETIQPTNRRHWEWCIVVLARSRHERLAHQIYHSLHPQEWSTPFLVQLCTILCDSRSFKLASSVASSLVETHPARKDLHYMVFQHASRSGLNKLARQSWTALRTIKDFNPTQYDHLLLRQALRVERTGKVSPLPVTRRLDVSDPRTVILGHRMLADTGRNKLANQRVAALLDDERTSEATQNWTSSAVLCTMNNILTSELRTKSTHTTKDIIDSFSRLFRQPSKLPLNPNATQTRSAVTPDPITLNIVLGAWMRLKEVRTMEIREMFDKLVSLGYPASSVGSGPTSVFGTRPTTRIQPIAGLVEEVLGGGDVMKRLSAHKHVLPLYKMFMKHLYMRGDTISARQVMYIYKGLKNCTELEKEQVTRERHLKSLGRRVTKTPVTTFDTGVRGESMPKHEPKQEPELSQPDYLKSLNAAQFKAVTHDPSIPLQILAGPGSGKTRVLTSRVAHLVKDRLLPPSTICAVTFTNKAANEMRHRLKPMIGEKDTSELIMGTFHAICSKYLRQYGKFIGLANNFSICDADVSKATVAKILKAKHERLKDLSVDLLPAIVQSLISKAKSRAETPKDVAKVAEKEKDDIQRVVAEVYEEYEWILKRNNSLDFDDLLIYGVRLFERQPHILQRCKHILVDEFQDTSVLQYSLVKLFALASKCVSIVGDPDQSIYEWRAAEIENLAKMKKDFPGTQQIFLEENYRSTGAILAISHAIVSQDDKRIEKGLFTSQPSGPRPFLRSCRNEHDEADFMADEIKRLIAYSGGMLNWNDFAILLRYNALSRPIESAFQKHGVPMRMLAGQRFFERAEVKDLLAYLQLADNPDYNPAFMRIINVPPRSMGDKSIAEVESIARRKGWSCWTTAEKICAGQVSGNDSRSTNKLKKVLPPFIKAIQTIRAMANAGCAVPDIIRRIIELVHYEAYLHKHHSDSESRWENLQELINFAEESGLQHAPQQPLEPTPKNELALDDDGGFSELIEGDSEMPGETPLRRFLQTSSLSTDTETSENSSEEDKVKVTVSTCHAAKGLEWPVVFIPSAEQGTFPFYRTGNVTEERRLLYVACTRAQAFLYLSCAASRMAGGSSSNKECSEFIIPLLKDSRFAERPPVVEQGVLRLIGSLLKRPLPSNQAIQDGISSYKPILGSSLESDGLESPHFALASTNLVLPLSRPAPAPYVGPPPQFSRAATLPRGGPTGLVSLVSTTFSAPAVSVVPGPSRMASGGLTSNKALGATKKPVPTSVTAYFKSENTQTDQKPLGTITPNRSNQKQVRTTVARSSASRDITDLTQDSTPSFIKPENTQTEQKPLRAITPNRANQKQVRTPVAGPSASRGIIDLTQDSTPSFIKPENTQTEQKPLRAITPNRANQKQVRTPVAGPSASRGIIDLTQDSTPSFIKPENTQTEQKPLRAITPNRANQKQVRTPVAGPSASREIIDLTKDPAPPFTSANGTGSRITPSKENSPITRPTTFPRTIGLTKDSGSSLNSATRGGNRITPLKENLATARPTAPIQLAGGKRRLGMGHIPDGFNPQPNKKLRGP
ncbi:hypothetical protein FRC05_003996 [Tulasnella sp. 425]|nr:hypothetical protein FRC05_003996 [Tulasnella sp. 425]